MTYTFVPQVLDYVDPADTLAEASLKINTNFHNLSEGVLPDNADQLELDFTPINSTPTQTSDTTAATQLAAHLNGIDAKLAQIGTTWGLGGTSPSATQTGWTVSNTGTDRTYDCNNTTIDELADIVGTLVADLIAKGILST